MPVSVRGVPTVAVVGKAVMLVTGICAAVGVTELEAADAGLVPIAFVAVTVKVYAVPLVKPVMVIGLVVPVAVIPPGFDVTVKPVIGLPPVLVGTVNDTVACPSPAVAVPMVGALGAVVAVHVVVRFTSTEKDCVTPPRVTEILKLPVLGVTSVVGRVPVMVTDDPHVTLT